MRGSYVDMTLSNGLSPKFAQNQLGHAKNSTTMDWYAKNSQDMIDIAQETFNQIFSSGEKMVKKNEVEHENKIISMVEYRNNKRT